MRPRYTNNWRYIMVQENNQFVKMEYADYGLVYGDFALWSWYSIIKDYVRLCKKDERGYTRVSTARFARDYGVDRMKIWRYNKKLEDKGLIRVDKKCRGGRTWIGFKLV